MVKHWSPDPPQNQCDSEVGPVGSSSFIVVGGSSSDSENDDAGNDGYELLPMTPMEDLEENSDIEEEENDGDPQTVPQSIDSELDTSEASDLNPNSMECPQLCNEEPNSECDQDMDPELMDKVRAAMSGFSLPLTAVPSWAFHVPEEEWHSHLVQRMQNLQQRSARSSHTNTGNPNVNSK